MNGTSPAGPDRDTKEPPTTIMLRRYTIRAGHWDPYLQVWREIAAVRRDHGFRILFALADTETNEFTWALEHDGDRDAIDIAAEAYYADPRRVALEHVGEHVTAWVVTYPTPQPLERMGRA